MDDDLDALLEAIRKSGQINRQAVEAMTDGIQGAQGLAISQRAAMTLQQVASDPNFTSGSST